MTKDWMVLRYIFLFMVFCIISSARENPFVPLEDIRNETPPKNNEVRWFKNINFTLPDSARILKNIKVSYQNLDGSIEQKIIYVNKKVDWHKPFILTQNGNYTRKEDSISVKSTEKTKVKTYKFKNFIKFRVCKDYCEIITSDTKIRDFMVTKPYKVVVDFKRDANFLTKTFKLNTPPFVSIVLGNHSGYYRVVVELDGHYIYKLSKTGKFSYRITLK